MDILAKVMQKLNHITEYSIKYDKGFNIDFEFHPLKISI